MDDTIRPASADELARIARQEAAVLAFLSEHYEDARLEHDLADLMFLQQVIDDGLIGPEDKELLRALGIVLGQVFAARGGMRWVSVERGSERVLALQHSDPPVLIYPEPIIAKRVEDGREVDVFSLYQSVVEQLVRRREEPRAQPAPGWESPVGDPGNLDLIGARHDGGIDLVLVCSRPLDDSPATREVLARKLRNYCHYVLSEDFAQEYGKPSEERTRILLKVLAQPPRAILNLLGQVWAERRVPARFAIEVGKKN